MATDQYYRTASGAVVWLSAADQEAIASGVPVNLDLADLTPIAEAEAAALIAPTPAPITAADVKIEAGRRLSGTDWYVIRAAEGGAAVLETVAAYRAAVRAASNEIEAQDPIPADYADDSYWPEVLL